MKRHLFSVVGGVVLLLGMGLNIQYALDDYGLVENKMVTVVFAQATSTQGTGSTGGGTEGGTGGGTGGGTQGTGDSGGSGAETFQIAEATRTEASGGWTFDAALKIWFLNGKAQVTGPSSSYTLKYKCCRPQGDVTFCPYERC